MKKAVIVLLAVVVAPIILVSVMAFASAEWRPIGATPGGDKVSVSSIRTLKKNQRTAWVRVEYQEPTHLPQGGPFVEIRARVRFNCGTGGAVPTAVWMYGQDRGGKLVVSKKATRDDQFGMDSEGGFGQLASQYVCQNK